MRGEANVAAVKPLPWVLTKMPVTQSQIPVTAPTQALDLLTFSLDTTTRADEAISRMTLGVQGTAPAGSFANFQIIYFPAGLKKGGTVVATNDGSTWSPIAQLDFPFATPIAVKRNFDAVFVLQVDVIAGATGFFAPRLETVSVMSAGVERLLSGADTCNLPMEGDLFQVN